MTPDFEDLLIERDIAVVKGPELIGRRWEDERRSPPDLERPSSGHRIMPDGDRSPPPSGRRKLSVASQITSVCVGLLFVPLVEMVSPTSLVHDWCPTDSYYARVSHLDWSFGPALILGFACIPALLVLLFSRVDLSEWSGAIVRPRGRSRHFLPAIGVLACGSILAGVLYTHSISYYCLAPDDILVRTGHRDDHYQWNDVKEVHGWCSKSTPSHGVSYPGAHVSLLLADGPELSLNSFDDNRTISQYIRLVEKSLSGKTYRYYVNATITPTTCPPGIYPLLWNWPDGSR